MWGERRLYLTLIVVVWKLYVTLLSYCCHIAQLHNTFPELCGILLNNRMRWGLAAATKSHWRKWKRIYFYPHSKPDTSVFNCETDSLLRVHYLTDPSPLQQRQIPLGVNQQHFFSFSRLSAQHQTVRLVGCAKLLERHLFEHIACRLQVMDYWMETGLITVWCCVVEMHFNAPKKCFKSSLFLLLVCVSVFCTGKPH